MRFKPQIFPLHFHSVAATLHTLSLSLTLVAIMLSSVGLGIVGIALAPLAAHAQRPRAIAGSVWTPSDVRQSVDNWASYYGISPGWLESVIACESHFNPYPSGSHIGPAQFVLSTFQEFQRESGIGGSPYDPDVNIRMAAWAHAQGYSYHWSCG